MNYRNAFSALVVLLLLLYAAPCWAPVLPIETDHVMPSPSVTYENEFSPDGSKCPGACGYGCPSSCQQEEFKRCDADNPGAVQSGERFRCGIHPACSDLDDCMDECAFEGILKSSSVIERLFGIEPAWAPVLPIKGKRKPQVPVPGADTPPGSNDPPDENPDFDQTACNNACVNAAAEAASLSDAYSWSEGGGPWKDAAIWEYTQETPEAPENTQRCGACETCRDGRCVHNPAACPTPGPPPPPNAPMISSGDVHLTSLDRRRLDYQGVGEFVLFEDDDKTFVLQARTKPWSTYASLNSAAAMRVGEHVVGFYIDPEFRILLNGAVIEIEDGGREELDGGGIERRGSVYGVTWPDGSLVQIYKEFVSLSIAARLSPERAGDVRGMVGDFDGDMENDFVTRTGETLPQRMTRDQLYEEYGHSWRIADDESLFVYGAGESTATFTDRDFPRDPLDLSSLDPAVLAAAEKACAEIRHPRVYRDCVFDVAVTGDPSYAAVHAADLPPESEVDPPYMDFAAAGDIGIEAPAETPAGADFTASWSGTRRTADFIGIAAPGADALDYTSYLVVPATGPTTLRAPERPGSYAIRYVQGNSIAAERPIEITQALVTLDAIDAAPGGSTIEIGWSGPDAENDYLGIYPVTAGDRAASPSYAYTRRGNPLPITVPDAPGRYEIRYVQGASRNVLRIRPLQVTAVTATLEAPDEAPSGSPVDVAWTGPDNQNDYLGIYAADDHDGGSGQGYVYTRQGNPLSMNVPDAPGDYEIRYLQGQSRTVLTARKITVTPVAATLEAPDEAPSGSPIDVVWTGPDNQNDYIGIYAADDHDGGSGQGYKYTRQGNPLGMNVPDAPGDYEIRYVQGQSRTPLTARRITVTPVTASLEVPAEAVVGSDISVVWTGPDNQNDYLGIFVVGGEETGRGLAYLYTRRGSPLALTMPDTPGVYEIRYLQGQSRTVLASERITVVEPD